MVEYSERFCPRYQRAVEVVGRRWSGAILRAMMADATRFGEILGAVPALSNRMLSERLKDLEGEAIVEREVFAETPVRVEYRLTEKGRALGPVVEALSAWADEWVDLDPAEGGGDARTGMADRSTGAWPGPPARPFRNSPERQGEFAADNAEVAGGGERRIGRQHS